MDKKKKCYISQWIQYHSSIGCPLYDGNILQGLGLIIATYHTITQLISNITYLMTDENELSVAMWVVHPPQGQIHR